MMYIARIGPGSIIATILFIPLFIALMLFIPVLIIIILFIAAAVGVAAILTSKAKNIGKKDKKSSTGKVIDAEYKIK